LNTRLRMGIAGLGGAGARVLSALAGLEGVELAAAADVRPEARRHFEANYRGRSFATVAEMCASQDIDAVYIATPSHLHCQHAIAAAQAGKHVICEKPMAVNLDDCNRMIATARRHRVQLLQGHSKVMDAPVRAMRQVIASGAIGDVFQIDSWNFNDWMRRPRLAAELDSRAGGGVVMRQGPPQVDIVRYLVGQPVQSVRAVSGRKAQGLDTEGHYAALITFAGGAAASISCNGYGYFDIAEFTTRPGSHPTAPRPWPAGAVDTAGKYGDPAVEAAVSRRETTGQQPFCGLTLVSCQRGCMRQSSEGIFVYTDSARELVPLAVDSGLAAPFVELRDALREGRPVFPDGVWGRETLAVCLAILASSREGREIQLPRDSLEPGA
jgi:phthalate 4,5-cis-dihydrodiol dehydrogenase